jgi:hypothetical protein
VKRRVVSDEPESEEEVAKSIERLLEEYAKKK